MKFRLCIIVGLFLVFGTAIGAPFSDTTFLECFLDESPEACKKWQEEVRDKNKMNRTEESEMGTINVNGEEKSEVTLSAVLKETGDLLIEGLRSLFGPVEADKAPNVEVEARGMDEARKKLGKKKKKHLMKLIPFALLLKSKLSFLLQLISTHLQVKFFIIAIISLIINIARFWLDLKKGHHPSKVIYYEHAQHQHHYDHEDDHHGGYWGRSIDESAQNLAYNAHAPEQ